MDFATTSLNLATLPYSATVTLGFYLIAAAHIIFSAILYYHWNEYGTDARVTKLTLYTYFGITIPLLLIMGLIVLVI